MILYGLRLLVALLTFAVGVTAAWLLEFKSAPVSTSVSVEREPERLVHVHPRPCEQRVYGQALGLHARADSALAADVCEV